MAARTESTPATGQNEPDFTPAPDEIARRAYLIYETEGCLPGLDLQYWLAAEAELIAEHNLSRKSNSQGNRSER